ncbi:hypothetical protein TTHERM_01276320 (macronuclear) [Tetrahymena thermophila SB210]|uniref:Uncharacterized protein n=1 Tax=Tetrahymena thermophila (strain SB210) TaxID=312017 RepID=Q22A77_TETTS|nr:hypothetical protein TTHERM_01276320 [Tetrahymena thermophila SB210]EAR82180.2 hypothetical protein TTHERM_01276320 [Tetrahymena thermophila SB210]|eukprot:XP_001029843.2 hypothetical protein TTHERM_01276320 [Tetrahymena thermophila SB210]
MQSFVNLIQLEENYNLSLLSYSNSIRQYLLDNKVHEDKYIQLMKDIKDLFSSPTFLMPNFSDKRKQFFSQLCLIAFDFANNQVTEQQSLSEFRKKFKFPFVIIAIIYTKLLEIKEALPEDFLTLVDCHFKNKGPQSIFASLTLISLFLNEVDQYEIDCDHIESSNTLSSCSEAAESNIPKKVNITVKTVQNFFDKQGLQMIAFPLNVIKNIHCVAHDQQSIIQLLLKIVVIIIKNMSNKIKQEFFYFHQKDLNVILSCFIGFLQQNNQAREDRDVALANIFEFCELLAKSTSPAQLYVAFKDFLVYISQNFSFANDSIEYFDFNSKCVDFLVSITPCFIQQSENLSAYPLIIQLLKQSAKINLVNLEDQIGCLHIWSHYSDQFIQAYDNNNNSIKAETINNLAILNSTFIESLQFDIELLFNLQIKDHDSEDVNQFVDQLSRLVIHSNLIDNQLFVEVIKSLSLLYQKNMLLYYTFQKCLMKQYLNSKDTLSQIYQVFGKSNDFLQITELLFESFSQAQKQFANLDLNTIAAIEKFTQFMSQIGAKLFNTQISHLEQSQILGIFQKYILNPIKMFNLNIFSQLPENFIQLNEVQFSQVCTMMESVHYFIFSDNKSNSDQVFETEVDVSMIKKILLFNQSVNQDMAYWINPQLKNERKKIKQFYQSTIYWVIFASINLENAANIFESYFFQKEFNIWVLNSTIKKLKGRILPNTFLLYLCYYLKSLTDSDSFSKIVQKSEYEEKFRKLMVNISKSVPSEIYVDYSKIQYYLQLYINEECQMFRFQILSDQTVSLLTLENRFSHVYKVFIILEDLFTIVQRFPKFYYENTFMGLKRNFFLNRVFWIIVKCFTIVPKQELLENSQIYKTISLYLNLAIRFKMDFLEKEETQSENSHYFNFILEILDHMYFTNKKIVLDFCQKILNYFDQDCYNQNIIQLAQSSQTFQNITLQLFTNIWEQIFNFCSSSNEKAEEFKEKDISQSIDFILKFSKCLQGNLSIIQDRIMLVIKAHPIYSSNSQIIYSTIIENLVIKEIDGVKVLQNVFLKSIIKDLQIWAKSICPQRLQS